MSKSQKNLILATAIMIGLSNLVTTLPAGAMTNTTQKHQPLFSQPALAEETRDFSRGGRIAHAYDLFGSYQYDDCSDELISLLNETTTSTGLERDLKDLTEHMLYLVDGATKEDRLAKDSLVLEAYAQATGRVNGNPSIEMANCYGHQARQLLGMGYAYKGPEYAKPFYEKAVAMYEKIYEGYDFHWTPPSPYDWEAELKHRQMLVDFQTNARSLASWYDQIATTQFQSGDVDGSLKTLDRELAFFSRAGYSGFQSAILVQIADVQESANRLDQALETIKKAFATLSSEDQRNTDEIGIRTSILKRTAHIHEALNQLADAEAILKQLANEHPWDDFYTALGNFYERHNMYDQEIALYEKWLAQLDKESPAGDQARSLRRKIAELKEKR